MKVYLIALVFMIILIIGVASLLANKEQKMTVIIPSNQTDQTYSLPTPNPASTETPTESPTASPSTASTPQPTSAPMLTPKPIATTTPTPALTPTPSPTPVSTPNPMPTPEPSSILFSDSFQSGDISAWTNSDYDGVTLTVKNSMLECSTSSVSYTNWGYVYKWLNQNYMTLDWRWYILFTNLPTTDSNIIGAGGIYNSGIEGNFTAANGVCSINILRQDGTFYWMLDYVNSSAVYAKNSNFTARANTWYLVELKAVLGTQNGEAHFYLNNAEVANVTGLTNANRGIDHVSVGGGIAADQPVSWYCAGAIASSQYIGDSTPSPLTVTSDTMKIQNFEVSFTTLAAISLTSAMSLVIQSLLRPLHSKVKEQH
jgi:hypothetical protein